MIVEPKVRGFICTTAHPKGCAAEVQQQIDYVKKQAPLTEGPKNVLVIGASNGYGLSTRIAAAFGGLRASTIGVFFEKPSDGKRTATAGWYKSVAFEKKAAAEGLYAKSFNGDAFSTEIKNAVIETIKRDWGHVDLLVYSLASPRRQDPKDGKLYKSVLKPIGQSYTNTSIDMSTQKLEEVTLPPASDEEINDTVKVMGGEDWELWVNALEDAGLIKDGFSTIAYSYIGPRVTQDIYRKGTIGRAKDHLEATAQKLNQKFEPKGGWGLISVNKALVTQSSSAIPFIPLYFVILKKIMKDQGLEENCIQQMWRLFSDRLYTGGQVPVDDNGFVRLDDWELKEEVQKVVDADWDKLTQDNLGQVSDLEGYRRDFMALFGFEIDGVDYSEDVDVELDLPSNSKASA